MKVKIGKSIIEMKQEGDSTRVGIWINGKLMISMGSAVNHQEQFQEYAGALAYSEANKNN